MENQPVISRMSPVRLTVIIPGYNRPEPLRYTLRSVRHATAMLDEPVEVLLVDDGSRPSLEEQLSGFDAGLNITHLRQPNQGSIVARLTGLAAARGEHVHFLDSDDLVHPGKYRLQLAAMEHASADISYGDVAVATLGPDYSVTAYAPDIPLANVSDPAELYLNVQPMPHNPVYRRSYLLRHLTSPLIAPLRIYDPAGDVWMFYNLCSYPAKIIKVQDALCAIGPHADPRFSQHWERLFFSSLQIAEAFLSACPAILETTSARMQTGICAFDSWRRLPRDFSIPSQQRLLALWRRAPRSALDLLGGPKFRMLARILGPITAARLMRFKNGPYADCRTIDDDEFSRLLVQSHTMPSSDAPSCR